MWQFFLAIAGLWDRLFGLPRTEQPWTADRLERIACLTVRVLYGKVPLPPELERLAVGHMMHELLVDSPGEEKDRLLNELEERGWFDAPTPMTEYLDWHMEEVGDAKP